MRTAPLVFSSPEDLPVLYIAMQYLAVVRPTSEVASQTARIVQGSEIQVCS
jgi:hypothetical protein